MEAEVVVVGSCNIDQIAYAPRLPIPGETIHGNKYEVGFGGKGANQCAAAAKLGVAAAMVAKVGEDDNGRSFIRHMKNIGVKVDHMTVTKNGCTGVAPITVAADGTNSIVIVSGANMLLSPEDVNEALGAISGAKILICQLEIEQQTTLHAMKLAKEAGITTLFNPAPAAVLSEEFYKYADIICLNETEASLLTGIKVNDVESAKVATEKMLANGCDCCITTLGKDGCVFADSETAKPVYVPSRKVDAVDTTGAGDAFIGALSFYLCRFKDLDLTKILSRACWIAAESVKYEGTQQSFPLRENLPPELFEIC